MLEITPPQIFPILETARLYLRELEPEDAEDLFAILSDAEANRFYDNRRFTQVEQVVRAIERHRLRFQRQEGLRWAITLKGRKQVIGNCGYLWDKENHFAILSYVLARSYWNQGIMTEALHPILRYGFEYCLLHGIEAHVSLPNVASQRVLQKLGFQEEGTRRERYLTEGHYYDEKTFSLLITDFKANILK